MNNTKNVAFIITPLNSIMMDQVSSLEKQKIKSCFLNFLCDGADTFDDLQVKCSVPMEDIEAGKYNIVYAHPEALLTQKGQDLLKSVRDRLCYLIVDEAHMIIEW